MSAVRIHRVEPGRLSNRVRTPVTKRDVANVFPGFIRDKLVAASLAPRLVRAKEIDRTIDHIKLHYPKFFRQEEQEQ